jgi:hypothetical protein
MWLTNESNKVYKIRPWVNVSCIARPSPFLRRRSGWAWTIPGTPFCQFCRVKAACNDVLSKPEEEIWFPHLRVWCSAARGPSF